MGDFVMPSLGAGMESGVLVRWKVEVGDLVARGDIIAEVETEKGLIEIEVFESGVVESLAAREGEKLPVGRVMASIAEDTDRRSGAEAPRATPSARRLALEQDVDLAQIEGSGRHGSVTRRDVTRSREPTRVRVTPYARRLAEERGIDLSRVSPGRDGIVRAAQLEAAPSVEGPSPIRRAIATAMSRSKREIPHYYLAHTIDLGDLTSWLAEENERRTIAERYVLGALLVRAVARAVREVPEMNARWTGEAAPPLETINVGVAVAKRGGGLVAPAIHDADRLALDELMRTFSDLVGRARRGSLRSSELADATITVTSLGERGVEQVFPIIHPPQVAMVGFGRVIARPWAVDGEVLVRPTVVATLAADHRVSDGHRGGLFLAAIDRLLQDPEQL